MSVPASVAQGQGLTAEISMTNTCDQAVKLALGWNVSHDLLVTQLDGTVLWQFWSEPRQAVLRAVTLEIGEKLTYTAEWNGKAQGGSKIPPGSYQLVGIKPSA